MITTALRRAGAPLAIFSTAVVTAFMTPGTAAADPINCGSKISGYTTLVGQLRATAIGGCAAKATRRLRVEIKRERRGLPDSLVAANETIHYSDTFKVSVSSCDKGRTAKYYGRSFFPSSPTYHDTYHSRQHTCNF